MLYEAIDEARVMGLARALASFQPENPDSNPAAMHAEREELALDAVEKVRREEIELSFRETGLSSKKSGNRIAGWAKDASSAIAGLTGKLPTVPGTSAKSL